MLIVKARNMTGTKSDGTSDYLVEVRINDDAIWKGTISGHTRSDGWQRLLEHIAERGKPSEGEAKSENRGGV